MEPVLDQRSWLAEGARRIPSRSGCPEDDSVDHSVLRAHRIADETILQSF